jgi:TonB family protein
MLLNRPASPREVAIVSVAAIAIVGMIASARPARAADDKVYRIGGGVSAPSVFTKTEPDYSEEARAARLQGTVILSAVIEEKGTPTDIRVIRKLGMGLDEKAVECVQQWRFKPGRKDGQPVKVIGTIEVNFRLPPEQ